MKEKLAIVIAALMITSIAFAISTTSVTATHEQTPEIDETAIKGETSMVLTITITNAGPAAIENVRITVPSGFENLAPVIKIPKDNIVELGEPDPNMVILPAGTLIQLTTGGTLTAPENTPVIIENGTQIQWLDPPERPTDAKLMDNLTAKITGSGWDIALGIGENLELAENVEGVTLTINGTKFKLVADTLAVRTVTTNVVLLPEKTLVQLVEGEATVNIAGKITTVDEVEVTGSLTGTPPAENYASEQFKATKEALTNTVYRVVPGDVVAIRLDGEQEVTLPVGAELEITVASTATLFENTEVFRGVDNTLTLPVETVPENQPKNWMQYSGTPNEYSIEWKGSGENQIASGGSLPFPFAVKTPSTGTYTIYVRTKDTEGRTEVEEVVVTVDATEPTVELAVTPEWAKANTKVTITVTADEPLAKLDNVMVAENESTENAQVEMTPNADKTVWTGTYTTSDNVDRDGLAMVYVMGAQLEDLFGNMCATDPTDNFNVDKVKPPTPSVMDSIYGWVTTKKYTNIEEWLIEGNAEDNYLNDVTNTENMTVKIRLGTTVYEVTSGENGYFYQSITLTEGTQEVGIQYIDPAGNVGAENAENITLDSIAPSITLGTITGVGYTKDLEDGVRINDNAPKITLTIRDAGFGADNSDFGELGDNMGYSVQLQDADKEEIENLVNALAHDNNVLAFENTISELDDNTYYIYVVAGDNIQMDNVLIKFVIDTAAPDAPTINDAYVIESTADSPEVVKDASRTIAGTAEAGADITVYGTVDTTEKVLDTATAGSNGKWTATFTLTAGSTTKIEMSATDEAGNESPSREHYGWMLADASAPSVTLAELSDTTDKTSITISGTVTKDAWEDWSEITLTVQVGTGSVEVPCVGGSYSYSLALSEGPNTIVVQATDGIGNASTVAHATVERTVTPWSIYAIVLVIVALILAAIAIFAGPKIWKR